MLLRTRGLGRYVALPILANTLVYAGVFALALWALRTWDIEISQWEFLGPVGGWLSTAAEWTLEALKWLVAIVLLLTLGYFTFTTVGMLIASPFHDPLSGRVEASLPGGASSPGGGLAAATGAALRGFLFALRTLAWQIVCMLAALPFLVLPVVGFIPLLVVVAWFSGLGFVDVPMARHDFRLRHRRAWVRSRRGAIFALGVAMELLFLVPFAGLLLLPLGVIGATVLFCETDWEEHFARAAIEPPPGFRLG